MRTVSDCQPFLEGLAAEDSYFLATDVDYGPDSREVVEILLQIANREGDPVFLSG